MPTTVILEGLNGVGKSAYAKAIADATGLAIYRPFRPSTDHHWFNAASNWKGNADHKQLFDEYRAHGVPVNSYVDDLYVADALRTLRAPALLDRSMPTSFVYETMFNEEFKNNKDKQAFIWAAWTEALRDSGLPLLYVYLHCAYLDSKERCGTRWHPNRLQWDRMRTLYDKLNERVARLPFVRMISVNTSIVPVSDALRTTIRAIDAIP